MPGKRLVIESLSVEAVGLSDGPTGSVEHARSIDAVPKPIATRRVYFDNRWCITPFFERNGLATGTKVDGPAVICEANTTTVIEPGWRAESTARGDLVLRRVQPLAREKAIGTEVDPCVARSVQQSFHVDRRTDGCDAREHCDVREHQGASRFLVRGVRRERASDRERASHACALGLDGRIGARDPATTRRIRCATAICTCSMRPMQAERTCRTSRS